MPREPASAAGGRKIWTTSMVSSNASIRESAVSVGWTTMPFIGSSSPPEYRKVTGTLPEVTSPNSNMSLITRSKGSVRSNQNVRTNPLCGPTCILNVMLATRTLSLSLPPPDDVPAITDRASLHKHNGDGAGGARGGAP